MLNSKEAEEELRKICAAADYKDPEAIRHDTGQTDGVVRIIETIAVEEGLSFLKSALRWR